MSPIQLRVLLVLAMTTGLRAQQPPAALASLRAAAQRDSNDALAHYHLAVGFLQASFGDSAQRELRTAIAIDPQLAVAYALLGRLLFQKELRDLFVVGAMTRKLRDTTLSDTTPRAVRMVRTAFLLDPLVEYGRPDLFLLPFYWHGTLQQAFRHLDQGRFDQARQDFGEIIRRTRHDPRSIPFVALWYHALVTLHLGLVDSAIVDGEILLDQALRREAEAPAGRLPGQSPEILYILAHLHQRGGHLQEAERLYLQVLEQNLGVYTAHMELARIHEAQGRWDEAIGERRSAIDVNPDDPSLVFDLGVTLANAGRDSLAFVTLQSAVTANPRETRASYALGIVAARLHRYDEARSALERFLGLAPSRYASQIADARSRLQGLPR